MFAAVCLILALNVPMDLKIQNVGADPPPGPVITAARDTLDLYGGPGTLEGKFETAAGLPDRQGWTTLDHTRPASFWNIATIFAANLDPGTPDNHAWWCGDFLPACAAIDSAWGYGNSWDTSLGWSAAVGDAARQATVTLEAVLNLDTEPGYDYLQVYAVTAAGPVALATLDGFALSLTLNESITFYPGDFTGEAADQVQLKLRFTSDGAWSDEDCCVLTAGAVQVDNLRVTIAQPGLDDVVGPVETCEPGTPTSWAALPTVGVGDFAQLWTGLDDLDPEQDNPTPQWAFLDDGIIVPGTGGSYCQDGYWCYGPDSLVVNIEGGLLGPGNYLRNSVVSPPVALPDQDFEVLVVSLDAYLHNAMDTGVFDPVGLTWTLESTADPAAQSGWEGWDGGFIYLSDDGNYSRITGSVPVQDLPPEAVFTRIVVTAHQMIIWDWGYHYSSPAPYFDNVRLQAVGSSLIPAPDLPPRQFTVTCLPNPFNPAVEIRWTLPRPADLKVGIYDVTGALVRTLHQGPAPQAEGSVFWRGDDQAGRKVAAGAYFCRLQAEGQVIVRKVLLLK